MYLGYSFLRTLRLVIFNRNNQLSSIEDMYTLLENMSFHGPLRGRASRAVGMRCSGLTVLAGSSCVPRPSNVMSRFLGGQRLGGFGLGRGQRQGVAGD